MLSRHDEKDVSLAHHPEELDMLKDKVKSIRENAPFFDIKKFAGYIEQSYLKIWERYENGETPVTVKV